MVMDARIDPQRDARHHARGKLSARRPCSRRARRASSFKRVGLLLIATDEKDARDFDSALLVTLARCFEHIDWRCVDQWPSWTM